MRDRRSPRNAAGRAHPCESSPLRGASDCTEPLSLRCPVMPSSSLSQGSCWKYLSTCLGRSTDAAWFFLAGRGCQFPGLHAFVQDSSISNLGHTGGGGGASRLEAPAMHCQDLPQQCQAVAELLAQPVGSNWEMQG